MHDAPENPLRPTSAYKAIFARYCTMTGLLALHPPLPSSICETNDFADLAQCHQKRCAGAEAANGILDKEFVMQGVCDHRRISHRDVLLCFWKGYGPNGDTWEPYEHLGSQTVRT